jgi:hypothetical protein
MWATSVIKKTQIKQSPIGRFSPNLVTLIIGKHERDLQLVDEGLRTRAFFFQLCLLIRS